MRGSRSTGSRVHRIHEEDPDEHGQRERGDETARSPCTMALDWPLDHFDQDFDSGLKAARHAGGRSWPHAPQDRRPAVRSRWTRTWCRGSIPTNRSRRPACGPGCSGGSDDGRCIRDAVGACSVAMSGLQQDRKQIRFQRYKQADQQSQPVQVSIRPRHNHEQRQRLPRS